MNFIILPNANNNTLLGIDFVKDAGIILNIPNASWSFADEDSIQHYLYFEEDDIKTEVHVLSFEALRPEEGHALSPGERLRLEGLLEENEDIFGLGGEPTPYAEHTIDTGDHKPIALAPYRMSITERVRSPDEGKHYRGSGESLGVSCRPSPEENWWNTPLC